MKNAEICYNRSSEEILLKTEEILWNRCSLSETEITTSDSTGILLLLQGPFWNRRKLSNIKPPSEEILLKTLNYCNSRWKLSKTPSERFHNKFWLFTPMNLSIYTFSDANCNFPNCTIRDGNCRNSLQKDFVIKNSWFSKKTVDLELFRCQNRNFSNAAFPGGSWRKNY